MEHVFVSPHPDDIALSCGGLVARLRDRGEDVAIVTVFSGPGSLPRLTPFQRLALGFGSKHKAQAGADEEALRAEAEGSGEGAGSGEAAVPSPAEVMGVRRAEDRAYADFVGAHIVHLDLPDAVFRGYEGDTLMGHPRPDDAPPVNELRRALADLRPDRLFLPMAIGGHVDHHQARRAVSALLGETPAPYVHSAFLYEDFPYALTFGFERLDQLDPDVWACLPRGSSLTPEYVDLDGLLDRKLAALESYASQMGRLFGGDDGMGGDVRARATRVGELGGTGPAERYWRITTG